MSDICYNVGAENAQCTGDVDLAYVMRYAGRVFSICPECLSVVPEDLHIGEEEGSAVFIFEDAESKSDEELLIPDATNSLLRFKGFLYGLTTETVKEFLPKVAEELRIE